MKLPDSARALIESNALAHMITLNEDGSPQVALVWAGLDGDGTRPHDIRHIWEELCWHLHKNGVAL